jgi:hypothetical protein
MRFLITAVLSAFLVSSTASAQDVTFVTYNVENLFDADGISPYDDYKTTDKDGNPQYTVAHLRTKLRNIAEVMKRYNAGKGPDLLAVVEIEVDQTPEKPLSVADFRKKYGKTTLDAMLKEPLADDVKTLPAELLLLKSFDEAGITGYDVAAGEPEWKNGAPEAAVKTVLFSKLTIQHDKTKKHATEDARPILEAWVTLNKQELVIFVNHWKSGAGDKKQEAVRIQNAGVLRARIDALAKERPGMDMILAGDFNSDYNHATRYNFTETGINTVLKAVGDEALVAAKGAASLYNLWYELPPSERKSDAYRTEWGTLMHLIVNGRLYDNNGFQYVDGSFKVGTFEGFNTLSWSGTPRRWSFGGSGSGYSDHFPLSVTLRTVSKNDTTGRISLEKPSVTDDAGLSPNAVSYKLPAEGDFYLAKDLSDASKRKGLMYQMFKIESEVSAGLEVTVNGEAYMLHSQSFDYKAALADVAGTGKKITVYGRLTQFRGKWQFTLDAPVFVVK